MPQSLQCPRCNGSVRVPDQAAGRRVKCPHCEQTFLAPGINQSEKLQEDDWLSLEESITPATSPPRNPSKQAPIRLSPDEDVLGSEDLSGAEALTEGASQKEGLDETFLTEAEKSQDQEAKSFEDPQGSDREKPADENDEFVLKLPDSAVLPSKSPAKTGNPKSLESGFLKGDEDILQQYIGDEFDDFITESEPVPSSTQSSQARGVSGIPGNSATPNVRREPHISDQTANPSNDQNNQLSTGDAQPVEYAKEYRVTCKICGSHIYAKASQAGGTTKCSDCFSEMLIPSPPRIKKSNTFNVDEAETFNFESKTKAKRRPDPFQKSAEQLLDEAERAEQEEPSKPIDFDVPKISEWFITLLSPFRDPTVIVHLAGLCILGVIPTWIALKIQSSVLLLALFPGGLIFALLSVSCGMAILLATANNEPRVSEWPTFDLYGWLEQLTLVGGATILAGVPCWVLSTLILGPHLLSALITMFSIYLLFPFIILSMLDMNSVFKPFSGELSRSVTKCEEAWGGFYFSSGLLFVGTFLCFVIGSTANPETCAMISIIAAETAVFIYFGMIGRLAYAIGQSVNAPPRKDEDKK